MKASSLCRGAKGLKLSEVVTFLPYPGPWWRYFADKEFCLFDVQYGLYLPSECFFDLEVLEGVDEEASPSEGRNAATWPSSPAVKTTPVCNKSGLFETMAMELYLFIHIDGSHYFSTVGAVEDDSLGEVKSNTTSYLDKVDL